MGRKLTNTLPALKKDFSLFKISGPIGELRIPIFELTSSSTRYLNMIKKLSILTGTKLYKLTHEYNGLYILAIGTTGSLEVLNRYTRRLISAIEEDNTTYTLKTKHDYKRKIHGNTAIAKQRAELISKACTTIDEWVADFTSRRIYVNIKVEKSVKIDKYCKDNLKHLHLKKPLRASNRT